MPILVGTPRRLGLAHITEVEQHLRRDADGETCRTVRYGFAFREQRHRLAPPSQRIGARGPALRTPPDRGETYLDPELRQLSLDLSRGIARSARAAGEVPGRDHRPRKPREDVRSLHDTAEWVERLADRLRVREGN